MSYGPPAGGWPEFNKKETHVQNTGPSFLVNEGDEVTLHAEVSFRVETDEAGVPLSLFENDLAQQLESMGFSANVVVSSVVTA